MKLLSGYVLLKITAEEKRKVFQKDVGDTVLFKAVQEEDGMAEAYAQSVQSAVVIAVADDVTHILPGDIAILDYVVDTLKEIIVSEDETGKLIVLDVNTVFHEDDNIIYASLKTKNDMYVWSKGDVETASLIYGVFRGDKLIPNPPYVFCEHKEFQLRTKTESDIIVHHTEQGTVIRRILVPNEKSHPDLEPGDYVIVQDYTLYERELDGKLFDVIMDQDIEIVI